MSETKSVRPSHRESFRSILQEGSSLLIIEKSKFIAYAAPALDESEAIAFVERIRKKHYDATHNVPVYVAGASYKFSDDGEPSGTAGAPILDMLRHENIRNVAIVVTRYFGGIKLGTGGLVRAYTAAAKQVLYELGMVTNDHYMHCRLDVPYHLHGRIENLIRSREDVLLRDVAFTDIVRLEVYVPPPVLEEFQTQITDASHATVAVECCGEQFLSTREGEVLGEYHRLLGERNGA